jgi:hypothetical protein
MSLRSSGLRNANLLYDRDGELYHPDNDEWNAIEEGFAQAKRGDAVSADEIAGRH